MRARLVRAIVGVTAAALLLFGLPLAVAVQRVYRDEEVIRLERQATAATQAVGGSVDGADPPELQAPRDVALTLYDRAGARRSGRGPVQADAVTGSALAGRVADATRAGRLVVAVPVARQELVLGAVRAERSDAIVSQRVHDTWLVMGAGALLVLALAGGLATVFAARLARPVERLSAAVRRLGDGDFASRAQPVGVAELDDAAAALNATAGRLGRLVERERAFSADASHQLRTPITALRLELEAVQALGARPQSIPAALGQVERLEATIATLLAAGRDTTAPSTPLDLDAILAAAESDWRGALAASGRPLRVIRDADVPAATATPGGVLQILQVLLGNATRHGAGAVTVRVRAAGPAVAIDVADEGPGVLGDVEAVFSRRATAGEGHGIGLNLARALASADGGRLILERPGPHPTFTLLLPAARPGTTA